ncbi:tetratricopeptide repeat protein [Kordia sp. SMS9]|uniref:tetratricopeptide repeat protein n=1 Tax=Kordia sp. SMS9 TaxID=2282170 RepID=UPI000E10A0DE|nr:tetratricopeptide repeat protein [Kordia sp. SMS9]AXG72227.1 tetratricopeptide repeat protein [Kordia sp. SMS9]
MKVLKIIVLLFLYSLSVRAQTQEDIEDVLKLQIETTTIDSVKIPLLLQLAEHVYKFDVDEARAITLKAKKIIDDTDVNSLYYQKQKAKMYQILADCDQLQDNILTSLAHVQKAIDIATAIHDSISLRKSYRIRGSLSIKNKDTIKGKEYYKKSVEIGKSIHDSVGIADSYIYLGVLSYHENKGKDSVAYYMNLSKKYDHSLENMIHTDVNLASFYIFDQDYEKARKMYESLIEPHKKLKNYLGLSNCYLNLGNVYAFLNQKEKSLQALDSAIAYAKILGNKDFLESQYLSRRNINLYFKDYKAAIQDFEMYKIYYDSINDLQEAKRFTELELNHQFDKEKEIAAIELKNEQSKKTLYIILFLVAVVAAIIGLILLRKNNKQRLQLAKNQIEMKEVEKLKADLALANREKELKKVVIENSITEEVLNKTLDDIKEIITFENEKERKRALKSLSASLLSEKKSKSTISNTQNYLDEVSMDFKVQLDTHFSTLKPREKELLCMMKLGLSTSEISKLFNTTIASIKSSRYRIRKKLGLNSDDDIIQYIESKKNYSV